MKNRRGIYIFTDASNGMKYIGQSINLVKRIPEHYTCKGNNPHFYHALALRPDQFGLEMIDFPFASNAELNALEICYIHVLETLHPNGYNLKAGGTGGSSFAGKSPEEMAEIKRKMSSFHTGKKVSEKTRRKISENNGRPMLGKKHSPETRKKISEAKKNISDETRRKLSEAAKGRKFSDEHRRKLSEANKRRNMSNETRQKIAFASRGRRHSAEAKRKISASRNTSGVAKGEKNPNHRNNRDKRRGQLQLFNLE